MKFKNDFMNRTCPVCGERRGRGGKNHAQCSKQLKLQHERERGKTRKAPKKLRDSCIEYLGGLEK